MHVPTPQAGLEKQQQAAEAEEAEAEALGLEGGHGEVGSAGRRTIESVKGAERVLEALKVLDEEVERKAEFVAALKQWEVRYMRCIRYSRYSRGAKAVGGALHALHSLQSLQSL